MKSLILAISKVCFVNCKWCYNKFSKDYQPIDWDIVLDFLMECKKHTGISKVTFSWWDPLARNDIVKILKWAYTLWIRKISIDTVWLPLLGDVTTSFWGNDFIGKVSIKEIKKYILWLWLPIDWSTNEVVSLYRKGVDCLLDKIEWILDICDQENINVCINTVVTKCNYMDIENICSLLECHSCVKKWQLFQYTPTHRYQPYVDLEFEISDDVFYSIGAILCDRKVNFMIELKSNVTRINKYVLVDHWWLVWMPDSANYWSKKIIWDISKPSTFDRIRHELLL